MERADKGPSTTRRLVETVLVAVAYGFLAKTGLQLAIPGDVATPVWPPSGFALAIILLLGRRVWPAIFIGDFAATISGVIEAGGTELAIGPLISTTGLGVGAVLQAIVGAFLIRRFIGTDGCMGKTRHVLTFAGLIPFIALVSSTISVSGLFATGAVGAEVVAEVWVTWWLGDSVGILVVMPVLMAWGRPQDPVWANESALHVVAVFLALLVSAFLVFGSIFEHAGERLPLQFLIWPVLLWLALRFSPRIVATDILIVVGVAIWQTIGGKGPYVFESSNMSLLMLQLFVSVTAITTMVIAALSREIKDGLAALQNSVTEMTGDLQRREQWLRSILEYSPLYVLLKDVEGRVLAASKSVEDLSGIPADELVGRSTSDLYAKSPIKPIPSDVPSRALAAEARVIETGEPERIQFEQIRDNERRSFIVEKFPLRVAHGEIAGICSLTTEVTEVREAEEALLQAQKMEAVGQLTAGVAHDFNNLLAIIQGNAELLTVPEKQESGVRAIVTASERGAELSHRLLAFSRRQTLEPRTIDLVELVEGMTDMLNRALGETISIESLSPDGPVFVEADPGQVENALLNLAINARDAMPGGGKLTIECGYTELDDDYATRHPGAEVGRYGVLVVSDNGVGMSPETLDRATEPFFTTKEVGEGSGLGLSMILGFAQQSGGHLSLYSELGAGTTAKLYLKAAEIGDASSTHETSAGRMPRGQGELILVIEDNDDVRDMAVAMLDALGYRTVFAANPDEARAILATDMEVEAVLSDVVLPGGQSGPSFVDEAFEKDPHFPVVLCLATPPKRQRAAGLLDRIACCSINHSARMLWHERYARHSI